MGALLGALPDAEGRSDPTSGAEHSAATPTARQFSRRHGRARPYYARCAAS